MSLVILKISEQYFFSENTLFLLCYQECSSEHFLSPILKKMYANFMQHTPESVPINK